MQIQSLTWQSLLFQLLLSLSPAAVALIATYITLRHQRKLKADELTISSTMRARELMFGLYEKRLTNLLEQSAALGETAAKVHVVLSSTADEGKIAEALSGFFSIVYSQAFQSPEYIEEVEAELSALGLEGKFADGIKFIKNNITNQNQSQDTPPIEPLVSINMLLKATAYMVNMQRAIVEVKANELFHDHLPPSARELTKGKTSV